MPLIKKIYKMIFKKEIGMVDLIKKKPAHEVILEKLKNLANNDLSPGSYIERLITIQVLREILIKMVIPENKIGEVIKTLDQAKSKFMPKSAEAAIIELMIAELSPGSFSESTCTALCAAQ